MRIPGIPYVQGRNDYTDWDGKKYGIAIHNTSNDASDEGEASYATRRTDGVSSHLYCDDDSVTQSLSLDDRAGHAGSAEGNDHSLSVEITGANGKSRSWWLNNVAWDKLGAGLAWVIRNDPDYQGFEVRRASVAEMRRNPQVKAFYGHNDMRLAWGGTTHTDPGRNFPWDRLVQAVRKHLGEEDDMALADERIRRASDGKWTNAASLLRWANEWSRRADDRTDKLVEMAHAAKQRELAILEAVAGKDSDEILATLEAQHTERLGQMEQMRTDLLERLDELELSHEEIVELVRQGQSGEIEAAEVVRLLGEKLTASAEQAGDDS